MDILRYMRQQIYRLGNTRNHKDIQGIRGKSRMYNGIRGNRRIYRVIPWNRRLYKIYKGTQGYQKA